MSGLCTNCAMSQNQVLEYQDVANALRRASTAVNAADCQGFLCGLICAGGFADQRVWVAEVFEAYDPKDLLQAEAFRLLQRLYEETLVGFNSPELDFQLLLPDDDVTLRERTQSLADWCCGFLAGLGMGGLPAQDQLSDEVNEVLGMVRGNTIRSRHLGHDIQAAFRNMAGGEVREYTKMLAESREQALDRMYAEAEAKGANAVVCLRFTTSAVMASAAELLAYGTAVKIQKK